MKFPYHLFIFAERNRNVSCYPGATRTHGDGRTRTYMSEFPRLAYHYRPHLHNRHQTVSTYVFRAVRSTMEFSLCAR